MVRIIITGNDIKTDENIDIFVMRPRNKYKANIRIHDVTTFIFCDKQKNLKD